MSDQDPRDKVEADLKKFKKKKKMAVPTEFLNDAKSYDDKLMLVRHLTDMEKGRVLLIMKSLLKDAVEERTTYKSKKK